MPTRREREEAERREYARLHKIHGKKTTARRGREDDDDDDDDDAPGGIAVLSGAHAKTFLSRLFGDDDDDNDDDDDDDDEPDPPTGRRANRFWG